MSDPNVFIVDFAEYCPKCEHSALKDTDEPCNECLDEAVNISSYKPVKFKEKKK